MNKPAPLSAFDRVEAARVRAGLNQRELCRRAKLPESLLSTAKSNRSELSVPSLTALARALDLPLSELLGEAPAAAAFSPAAAGPLSQVPLLALHPSPLNPRKTFDPEKLDELAASITEQGVLEPLMVRPRPAGGYWIVFGERRFRAAVLSAKRDPLHQAEFMVPVVIREMTDAEHLTLALIENSQREDVPPLEEAEAFAKLQELDPAKWTGGEIARAIGKSPRHVQLRLALLTRLDKTAVEGMKAGKISMAQARELMLVPKVDQVRIAKEISKGESMTAEQVREEVMFKMVPVESALFEVEGCGLETFDEQDGKKVKCFFTDRAAFDKLQNKEIKALSEKLAKEWKWVEIKRGHFSSYNYGGTSTDKTKAGVVIEVSDHSGAVKVHKGILKRSSSGSGVSQKDYYANYDKMQRARRAREKAGEAMAAALTERLRKDWPNLVRLLMLASITAYNSGMPDLDPRMTKDMVSAGPFKALQPHMLTVSAHGARLKDKIDHAAVWKALAAVPDAKLDDLLQAMLLSGIGCETGKPGTWLIAEALGVKLEANHDEIWRRSLKGKIKGITKPQLELEAAIARAPKGAPAPSKKAAE